MKFGITTNLYTPSEYLKVSLRQNSLALSLMTIIMLFFMMSPKDYIDSKNSKKQIFVHIAGYSGMFFAVLSSFDGFFRPKFLDLRIFDELAICAAYACLWSLLAVVFESSSRGWFIGTLYVSGIVVGAISSKYFKGRPRPNDLDETAKAFIGVLANNSSPAAANARTLMALYAVVNQPGDPATSAMLDAGLAAINGHMNLPVPVEYSRRALCHNCCIPLAQAFHIPAGTATPVTTATPVITTATPVITTATPVTTV